MKSKLLITMTCVALGLAGAACDVEQTREAEAPDLDVDVQTEPGQMPAYDVDWADVDVGMTTKTVTVPKLVVVTEEEEVEVPYLDFKMPGEADVEERTIMVEVELEGEAHELDIEKVYGADDRLIVVSRLEPTGRALDDQRVRVSDRVVVNAPELSVDHYIIGQRPEGDWNRQYTFVTSENELGTELEKATLIYSS